MGQRGGNYNEEFLVSVATGIDDVAALWTDAVDAVPDAIEYSKALLEIRCRR